MIAIPSYAQTGQDWWYTLELGKKSFREGSYGDALLHFEDARRQRRAMYERMEKDMIDFLSLTPVRRLSNSLDKVDAFARERRYDGASAALDEAYFRFPKADFSDSAIAVLEALGRMKNYPEAEYWIGETYRVEGELSLALAQYQKVWDQRDSLEQKAFETDIMYKIANVHKTLQDYYNMERKLLGVLDQDALWSTGDGADISVRTSEHNAQNAFARNAMRRTLENEGVGRFLALYRYINMPVEQAHRLLGLYYYASGRHHNALEHLMFAFLIQSSVIIEEVIRHDFDFEFSSLDGLMPYINRFSLISDYVNTVDFYRTAYYLGCSLHVNGKTPAARTLWSFLAFHAPAGEWQNRARSQLRQPQVERIVERP